MVDIYFLADGKNHHSCYCCTVEHAEKTSLHCDSIRTLQRLCIMLVDPEAKRLINRHILLINHYIGLSNNQFKIFDMHYLMVVLEYLCREVESEPLYETPLRSLLYMIQKPPIVYLNSHSNQYQEDLTNYFSALANCYLSLKDHEFKFLIISAANNMVCLVEGEEKLVSQPNAVLALEDSDFLKTFSTVLANPIEIADLKNILDILIHFCMISDKCCFIMYKENYVERLLNVSPFFLSKSHQYHTELHRTAYLLLKILEAALNAETYPPLCVSQESLRTLRSWFKNRVVIGPKRKRNLLMTIILAMIQIQQNIDFASCKLLEDIILLSITPKWLKQESWAKDFELRGDTGDFEFMKLLLLALYGLFDFCPTKIVCTRLESIIGLSQLLDLKLWPNAENNILLMYSLHLIPKVAKYMHEQIIKYDLITKMIIRSGKLVEVSDCDEVFFYLIQSLYSLTLNDKLIQYFKEKNIIPFLLDYCETILEMNSWSLRVQLVLQYTLNSLVNIASKLEGVKFKSIRIVQQATLSSDLLKRYLHPTENDSIFDPCLLVSIADFIWIEQSKDAESRIEFLKSGGIYLILDVIEQESKKIAINGSTLLLLGLLSNLVEDDRTVTQVATWQGTTHKCLINMLCDLWRRVEKEKQVKRYQDAIEDCEAPLMGAAQLSIDCKDLSSCPPLLEMSGCLRPKILSIISQLLNNHKKLVEVTEETYNVQPRRLSTQDQITLKIIENYEFLKEGEIWQNMLRTMRQNNTNPLAGDEYLLHTLILKHITHTRQIQQYQIQLLNKQINQELDEEKNLYENIKINKVVEDLGVLRQTEKNLMIKNPAMRNVMKQVQLLQIEEATQNEWKKFDYLRTYNDKNNSTTIKMGRNVITSGKITKI